MSCLKFFISDVKEKGMKTIVVLTNVDRLNYLKENDRLMVIEDKISIFKK